MTAPDKNTMQYQENTVSSARPEDLTLMMYNGLLKFIARAQEEIRGKLLEAAHNTLIRCQDIVFEFQYALNMDYAVSNNLMLLYDFLYNRLIEANAKKDCAILDEVSQFVAELRDAWTEAVKLNKEYEAEAADDASDEVDAEVRGAEAADELKVEIEVDGASVRIGAGAPQAPRTKAIYKRSGMPLTQAQFSPPQQVASAQQFTPPQQAAPTQQITRPQQVAFAPVKTPAALGAAAQYAKVSKSKKMSQENISIVSK